MTCNDDSLAGKDDGVGITPSMQGQADKSDELPEAAPASYDAGAAPGSIHDEAFAVLRTAVQALLDRSKQPKAAAVKTEMQRLTSHNFDESKYGYSNFRKFLTTACQNGIVVLVEAATSAGDPLLVTLPGREVPPAPFKLPRRGRIRPDVWRAFTSWEHGYTRLWDVENDRAIMFPTAERPLEPPHHRMWREETVNNPARFRRIDAISEDQLTSFMRSFIAGLDAQSDAVSILNAALAQDRPARSFTAAARALPGIADLWKRERFEFVRSSIAEWQTNNSIQSSIEEASNRREDHRSSERPDPSGSPADQDHPSERRPVETAGSASDDAIRERIFAALARMPLSELLRLRVPVEYLLDR